MNNSRRKALNALLPDLERLKNTLEALRDEEQESFDNMPEGLKASERGEQSENAINCLDFAVDGIETTIDNITEATN